MLGDGVVAPSVAVEKSLRVALVGFVMGIGVGAFLAAHVQSRKDTHDWLIPAAHAASLGLPAHFVSPSGGSIGIGFAIPAETVKIVVDQLKEKGVVTRGWIGLQVRPISPEIAARIGLKEARGALVGESQANGPAAGAGIVAGDVIASLDDQPVKDHRDLVKKISRAAPGTTVELGVFRKGEHKSVTVTLAEIPK